MERECECGCPDCAVCEYWKARELARFWHLMMRHHAVTIAPKEAEDCLKRYPWLEPTPVDSPQQ